jgi:organic radical activating enzyme
MLGKNPIRPPVKGEGETLEIQEIFPTIQGEGPHTGAPAVFVRLGGCNLACSFCDTEFESFASMALSEVLTQVETASKDENSNIIRELVVVTGGEPLRQPIEKLCHALLEAGYRVQIETNGTLYRELDTRVEVVCSPKNTNGSYKPLRPDVLTRTDALKFIIAKNNSSYDHVPELGQKENTIPVYVQPMDEQDVEKNKENHAYAKQLAEMQGYHFSIQMHKVLNIP